jgi:hypothetical protein
MLKSGFKCHGETITSIVTNIFPKSSEERHLRRLGNPEFVHIIFGSYQEPRIGLPGGAFLHIVTQVNLKGYWVV